MAATITVHADWLGLTTPLRLGWLHVGGGAGREVFEFEFDRAALAHPSVVNLHMDPRLGLFEGRQHPPQGHETFGVFADASPDRWGRMLMRRRLERAQRAGRIGKAVRLHESDYLMGVHDAYRSGALRLRLDDAGDFLDNQHGAAAPPFVQLRGNATWRQPIPTVQVRFAALPPACRRCHIATVPRTTQGEKASRRRCWHHCRRILSFGSAYA